MRSLKRATNSARSASLRACQCGPSVRRAVSSKSTTPSSAARTAAGRGVEPFDGSSRKTTAMTRSIAGSSVVLAGSAHTGPAHDAINVTAAASVAQRRNNLAMPGLLSRLPIALGTLRGRRVETRPADTGIHTFTEPEDGVPRQRGQRLELHTRERQAGFPGRRLGIHIEAFAELRVRHQLADRPLDCLLSHGRHLIFPTTGARQGMRQKMKYRAKSKICGRRRDSARRTSCDSAR